MDDELAILLSMDFAGERFVWMDFEAIFLLFHQKHLENGWMQTAFVPFGRRFLCVFSAVFEYLKPAEYHDEFARY